MGKRIHLRFPDRSVRLHGVYCNHFGASHFTDDEAEVTCLACLDVVNASRVEITFGSYIYGGTDA